MKKRIDKKTRNMGKELLKKILSKIVTVIIIINLFYGIQIPVMADTYSGTWKENIVWSFESTSGTLTVSGYGEIADSKGAGVSTAPTDEYPEWIKFRNQIKKITVEEGVTAIGNYAFAGNDRKSDEYSVLEEVELPQGMLRIGDYAFAYARKLSKITLPMTTNMIGLAAFVDCEELKSIDIPANVEKLGERSFQGTGLENVVLNEGIKEIGYWAFDSVPIKKIILPDSVETLGGEVFVRCENLEYIKLGKNIKNFYTSNAGLSLAGNFRDCPLLKTAGPDDSFNIHYTWDSEIPNEAFFRANKLEKVEIPNNIKRIGNNAFSDCSLLKEVKLENGINYIGQLAFRECNELNNINLCASLEKIDDYAFISTGIKEIEIPQNIVEIGEAAFGYIATIVGKDSHLLPVKIEDYVIKGYLKSAAEQYASENGFAFVRLDKDNNIPNVLITSTNKVASVQTVTLSLVDDSGIAGYYWGTSSNYIDNAYTTTNFNSIEKEVSVNGTYYLTAKDTSGNISQTKSVTFYKTILNASGGSLSPSYVITKSGNSFTMPIPTRIGYTFNGWSVSDGALSGNIKNVMPTGNGIYYATWYVNVKELDLTDLTYSFSNSHSGFNYSSSYTIPYSSYKIIYGDTTLAKKFYSWYNGLWGGNCYGMASTSGMLNVPKSGVQLLDFNSMANKVSDLTISNSGSLGINVTKFIEAMQVSQYSRKIQSAYNSTEDNLLGLSTEVNNVSKTGKPVIVAVFGPQGGHALLGYKIVKVNSTTSYLYVYDCNYPSETRYITLTTNLSGAVTGWYYPLNDIYDWGSSYSGCSISYITYDNYQYMWANRGNITSTNILNVNSDSVNIYDYKNDLVATVENGIIESESDDIFLIKDMGITADGNYIYTEETKIMLPTDLYTVENTNGDSDNFEATMVNLDRSATVTTTSDKITFAVDDRCELNDVSIASKYGDKYQISLESSDAADIELVEVEGISKEQKVNISQERGNVSINNCIGANISINGSAVSENGSNNNYDISKASTKLEYTVVSYDGEAKYPKIIVVDSSNNLLNEGIDYVPFYSNNTKEGIATVTLYGIGAYSGKKTLSFIICEHSNVKKTVVTATTTNDGKIECICKECGIKISTVHINKIKSVEINKTVYAYTGNSIRPEIIIKDRCGLIISPSDYDVTYSNNINVGKGKAVVTFKGKYSGIVTKTFVIKKPIIKKTSVNKLFKRKKSFKVTWKKVKGITGYQIQYSSKRNMKEANYKKVSVKKSFAIIKKLNTKKKYYVRIRAYKKVGTTAFYSKWCRKKSVETK